MRSAAIALAAACCSAACGDRVYPFDPPVLEEAKALIFIFDLEPPQAFAVDPTDETQRVELFFNGGEVEVYALLYDRTLADLRIAQGTLPIVVEGRELPDADRPIQKSIVGSGRKQAWTDVAYPEVLRAMRIPPDPNACEGAPRFTLEHHPLETKTNGRDILALDGGTAAMITADDGTFYRIGRDHFSRMTLAPGLPSGAVHRTPDGSLWFAGRRGVVMETKNGAIVRTATTPSGGDVLRMVGPRDASDEFELLMLDFSTSSLMRYDGTTFKEISRDFPIIIGDLAWTGPRRGLAVRGTQTEMLVIDDDRITEENVNIAGVGADSLTVHPELGPFVGSVSGRIVRKKNGAWIDLGDLGVKVESLAPYGEGIVAGGVNGFYAYWSERTGLCVEQLFPQTVEKIQPIGEDIAVTLLSEEWEDPANARQPTYAIWMRRMP